MTRVLCSGGFDPLHIGHVEYLQSAATLGEVYVALNSDAWLVRKKGYAFMPWNERAAILRALGCVHEVIPVDDTDGTVCAAIVSLRPDVFAKGGDRHADNTPEAAICRDIGIGVQYGLGLKIQSSSALVDRSRAVQRSWGEYSVLYEDAQFKVKALRINPWNATSLQRHQHRSEVWVHPDGTHASCRAGEWHQVRNDGGTPLTIIEVQTGQSFNEDDIERA